MTIDCLPAFTELEASCDVVGNNVAVVTLTRPERLNTPNSRMHLDLITVWEVINIHPAMLAGVVTDEGQFFRTGRGIKELANYVLPREKVLSKAPELAKATTEAGPDVHQSPSSELHAVPHNRRQAATPPTRGPVEEGAEGLAARRSDKDPDAVEGMLAFALKRAAA